MKALVAAIGFSILTASPLAAKVMTSTPTGFAVSTTLVVPTSPAETYDALTRPGLWWDTAHSYSGNAAAITIDAVPGGCFCETLPRGGFVEHARVVFAWPGKLLRLRGALGPLGGDGVDGALSWELKASGSGTEIVQTYVVGGYLRFGMEKMAPMVSDMLEGQAARLKAYLDKKK